jgi:HK97 family phage major capsid protein
MSDLATVTELFSATQKAVEVLQAEQELSKKQMADVVTEEKLARIQADLAAKFTAESKAVEEYKLRLEKLETLANRPNGAGSGNAKADEYQAKFNEYVKTGQGEAELKAMATNVQADGGFAVPDMLASGIQERLRRSSPVRSVANVVSFSGGTYSLNVERGDAGFEWAGETQSRSETATPTLNKINIEVHELSALPKVSQRMLDVADFDVEGWLTGYVDGRFARGEATAFVSGDGVNKPKGFLSYSKATNDDAARAIETLQYRVTGTSGAFNSTTTANVLTQTFYDLQGDYQANAAWMMKNTTAAVVATLKDANGSYLLQSMLNTDGQFVRTIQGRPVAIADDMPAIAADSYSIAVGDFSRGYTIVDGKSVTVLRDPYSAKPNVLFYVTKRVGGGVTDFDAIKLIKFGTA